MKLINSETKVEVKIGDILTSFRGNKAKLLSITKPHHSGSTGRVYVELDETNEDGTAITTEYYPGVYGLEWSE